MKQKELKHIKRKTINSNTALIDVVINNKIII